MTRRSGSSALVVPTIDALRCLTAGQQFPEEGARLLPEGQRQTTASGLVAKNSSALEDGRIKASVRAKACRLEIFPDRKKLLADWSSKSFLEVRLTMSVENSDYECNPVRRTRYV